MHSPKVFVLLAPFRGGKPACISLRKMQLGRLRTALVLTFPFSLGLGSIPGLLSHLTDSQK